MKLIHVPVVLTAIVAAAVVMIPVLLSPRWGGFEDHE